MSFVLKLRCMTHAFQSASGGVRPRAMSFLPKRTHRRHLLAKQVQGPYFGGRVSPPCSARPHNHAPQDRQSTPPIARGSLQTRTTLHGCFYSSERLRALMGPVSSRGGSLGGGGPKYTAGDIFCYFWHAERPSTRQRLGPSAQWQSHKRPEVAI